MKKINQLTKSMTENKNLPQILRMVTIDDFLEFDEKSRENIREALDHLQRQVDSYENQPFLSMPIKRPALYAKSNEKMILNFRDG